MKTSSLRTKFFALIMIAVLVINMLLAAPQQAFAQTRKPNIVFILVDDMDAATIDRRTLAKVFYGTIKGLAICN
jgi:N-acetylglucosamine-6-sulfatase